MLARLDQERFPHLMPDAWRTNLTDLLHQNYEAKCVEFGKHFECYGLTYPNELLLAVSLLDNNDPNAIPVTYLASSDLTEKSNSEKIFDSMIDSIGLFLDQYFSNPEWDDYEANWNEVQFKGTTFHYSVTRDNVKFTLEADRLLSEE